MSSHQIKFISIEKCSILRIHIQWTKHNKMAMQCSLEIIYPRSEGLRKLVPTNVNETFPLCLIHPTPLYVPRLFHHRCFLIFSRPTTLELASGRGSTTSCHFIILAHSSLRLGHERGDYLGLRDVSTLYGAVDNSLFWDQQITVNFISRVLPSFLFKIFRPDN